MAKHDNLTGSTVENLQFFIQLMWMYALVDSVAGAYRDWFITPGRTALDNATEYW